MGSFLLKWTHCSRAAHVKISRVYTLAEILSKIFEKREKIEDLIYDHCLTNLRFGANLIFI